MTTPEIISEEEMRQLRELGLRGFGEDLCTSCAEAGVGVCSLFSVLNYNESTSLEIEVGTKIWQRVVLELS